MIEASTTRQPNKSTRRLPLLDLRRKKHLNFSLSLSLSLSPSATIPPRIKIEFFIPEGKYQNESRRGSLDEKKIA